MKTLVGFALGTLLSLGAVTSASAAGANGAAPLPVPDAGIEVIVVTAKRVAVQPLDAEQPIEVFVVTAKRAVKADAERTPPAMPIVMPKLELATSGPVIRL